MSNEKKRILIVDDEQQLRYSISLALKISGINVNEASDGQEALKILKQARFLSMRMDLIIMDLQLPIIKGIDLIDKLKHRGYSIPILITSGDIKIRTLKKLKEKGCIGVLKKPFNLEQLLKYVNSIFYKSTDFKGINVYKNLTAEI